MCSFIINILEYLVTIGSSLLLLGLDLNDVGQAFITTDDDVGRRSINFLEKLIKPFQDAFTGIEKVYTAVFSHLLVTTKCVLNVQVYLHDIPFLLECGIAYQITAFLPKND